MAKIILYFGNIMAVSNWTAWPFGASGYSGGFWPIVARFGYVTALFLLICLFLRLLFGPRGPLRGEGWETRAEARQRREKEQAEAPDLPGQESQKSQESKDDECP